MSQLMNSDNLDALLDELHNDGVPVGKLLDFRSGVLGNNKVCFNELMELATKYGHVVRSES